MSEVTSSVKISRCGDKESKAVLGYGQVSQECGAIDECCWVERRTIQIQDNIWLEGDPGFPILEQCFPKLRTLENTVDKKYGFGPWNRVYSIFSELRSKFDTNRATRKPLYLGIS
ncbi:BnaC03g44560D [Brassica napus]|uniref:BnaC03g44560D protein n=1 Tax=Brassica napus TaxID=3708 RepID=A0A078FKX3_BRANA|nr:BnaC03g44560D [Brassica napus]